VQDGSSSSDARRDAPQVGIVVDAVLAEAEAALDAGDGERARRLIAVVRELQALGMGPRGSGGTGR